MLGRKSQYKSKCAYWPCRLSELTGHKNFLDLNEEDIQKVAAVYNKEEIETDPKHHWIGTYNQVQIHINKFFFSPDTPHKKRPRPNFLANYDRLLRQEDFVYEASDIWSDEDHLIFLKYCSGDNIERDKALHMVFRDTTARPHELSTLKIKDIDFGKDRKFVDVTIGYGGKTGPRKVILTDSLPYLMDWRHVHPERHNKNAVIFCSHKTGEALDSGSINELYVAHRKRFIKLLQSGKIPEEDRAKMDKLLQKPFNPYIQRHSSITEHAPYLSDALTCQLVGWKQASKQAGRYRHLKGNEARDQILERKGIIKPDEAQKNILAPKICPLVECKASNAFDALRCSGCGFIFSFEEHHRLKVEEEQAEKQRHQDMEAMRDQIQALARQVLQLTQQQQNFKDDYNWEKDWVQGEEGKSKPTLIKQGSKVNRLAIDAILGRKDKKISEEDRIELEQIRSCLDNPEEYEPDYYL